MMIKYSFLLLAFAPQVLHAQDPQQYKVKGYIAGLEKVEHNKAVMMHLVPGRMVFDTADVIKGAFEFTGRSPAPQNAYVYVTHDGKMPENIAMGDCTSVYLENGTVEIKGKDSLKTARVGGTRLNNDQQALMELLQPVEQQVDKLEMEYATANNTGDSLEIGTVRMQYEAVVAERDKMLLNFVKGHPNSLVSLMMMRKYFDPSRNKEMASAAYDLLDPNVQNSSQGVVFSRKLQRAKLLDIGAVAPEFAAESSKGGTVALNSFRGKYVLVDFWASWCAPCRRENPNVLKAYNRFKDRNFTVLGFSLDDGTDGKEKWLTAIEKDGLPWTQISDLSGFTSPVVMMYNLKAIPANFLLDPAGRIIAINLRGEELEAKLAQVFEKG